MDDIKSGDTVLHPRMGKIPLTVVELLGTTAICGYSGRNNHFVDEAFKIGELTKTVDGNTEGK